MLGELLSKLLSELYGSAFPDVFLRLQPIATLLWSSTGRGDRIPQTR